MTSLVGVVAPCTGKIIRNCLFWKRREFATKWYTTLFLKEKRICYKMVYYTLYLSKANGQKLCYKVRILNLGHLSLLLWYHLLY